MFIGEGEPVEWTWGSRGSRWDGSAFVGRQRELAYGGLWVVDSGIGTLGKIPRAAGGLFEEFEGDFKWGHPWKLVGGAPDTGCPGICRTVHTLKSCPTCHLTWVSCPTVIQRETRICQGHCLEPRGLAGVEQIAVYTIVNMH